MNIVLGDDSIQEIKNRVTVLELDSFRINGDDHVTRAWCVLEDVPLQDLMHIQSLIDLHTNLMRNYRLRNWNYCQQAIEHLHGHWNGQLDSFYQDLSRRIEHLLMDNVDPDWDGIIEKNP